MISKHMTCFEAHDPFWFLFIWQVAKTFFFFFSPKSLLNMIEWFEIKDPSLATISEIQDMHLFLEVVNTSVMPPKWIFLYWFCFVTFCHWTQRHQFIPIIIFKMSQDSIWHKGFSLSLEWLRHQWRSINYNFFWNCPKKTPGEWEIFVEKKTLLWEKKVGILVKNFAFYLLPWS